MWQVRAMALEGYEEEFGYSFSDVRKSYSRRAYEVPDYDKHSMEEIERFIGSGSYSEREQCMEHIKYLEGLQKKFAMIMLAEEREGVMNWELRESLEKARRLLSVLSSSASSLPTMTVYR